MLETLTKGCDASPVVMATAGIVINSFCEEPYWTADLENRRAHWQMLGGPEIYAAALSGAFVVGFGTSPAGGLFIAHMG